MEVRSFLERKEFIRRRGGRRQGNRVKGTKLSDLCVWNWIICSSPDSSQQHRYLSVAALHHQPLELWIHVQNSRNLVASYRCMHPTERGNRSLQSLGPGSATPCLFAVKTMQGSKWPATEKWLTTMPSTMDSAQWANWDFGWMRLHARNCSRCTSLPSFGIAIAKITESPYSPLAGATIWSCNALQT